MPQGTKMANTKVIWAWQGTAVNPFKNVLRHFQRSASTSGISGAIKETMTENDTVSDTTRSSAEESFAASRRGTFYQDAPVLGNQFTRDAFLQTYLKRVLSPKVSQEIIPDLTRFGERVSSDVYDMGRQCELNPPVLEHFDAWGRRVDTIKTCEGWKKLHDVSAEEGLIAIAYEREHGQWSRMYQTVKMYLFAASSGLYSCPLAMTDGAAKTIEVSKLSDSQLQDAYKRLTSRDPRKFWTSGQWMTEKRGGSDVANGTETIAVPQDDGSYKLYGYKWFSSATDSDMSLALARIQTPDGYTTPGSKGITMFYMETRDENGMLNNIEVQKLKNKLGTRQVPTAELLLHGSRAYKVSEEGRGIPSISEMLTITRIHNSISAVSSMRRLLNLAQDYCLKRKVFGKRLVDHPLHVQTLARLEVEVRAGFLFVMELSRMLGLEECGESNTRNRHLLRLLTPLAKLYTAKQAMQIGSEALESFGGQGYIEDTGLPGLFRDAQVLPIWEGTTNVLSLDVLRSIFKSQGQVLRAFHADVKEKIREAATAQAALKDSCEKIQSAADRLLSQDNLELLSEPLAARDLAYSLARIYMGALMVEHSSWKEAKEHDIEAAKRWCQQDLVPVLSNLRHGTYDRRSAESDLALVMDGHPEFSCN